MVHCLGSGNCRRPLSFTLFLDLMVYTMENKACMQMHSRSYDDYLGEGGDVSLCKVSAHQEHVKFEGL